eukprot:CAMPEP_0206472724 /NCGR_PEP_ID=MMETSP0324_2-20121206/32390_1 /ASSEMBLY_ACC=CAM_ASM_000836 /TAXON_ID=2866 /ORGANISM="Crypthecodinium cohnii, Strain Seligo" /LENGTH=488 /DNA_ID=CAMNT_0053947417 /DNA_START=144 /DNA_END=1611 /DNA_ORIENTATION=-
MASYSQSVFLELFLTFAEKDRFAEWKEVVIDRSFVNRAFAPVFRYLAKFVPETVAPNVLTLSGSLAVLQAWHFCEEFSDTNPQVCTAISIAAITIFWGFGGIDGMHARRTMNDTSLGELFKYVCDLLSSVFLVVVLCSLLLEKDLDTQWYCVQSVQLVLLMKHYSAFMREAGVRYFLVGPGELISWVTGLLALQGIGINIVGIAYNITWQWTSQGLVRLLELDKTGYLATMSPARAAYLTVLYFTLCRILSPTNRKHIWTRASLAMILLLRTFSGTLRMEVLQDAQATTTNRELHVWVVLMASLVVLPHLSFITCVFVAFYYVGVFADLMYHMNLPLLQVVRNVYCDGIYDLCHVGHKNLFRKALTLGNRLFVGVVGDDDANSYKRPPIMTAAERENEVASCKCVTKVIPNAPCFGLTREFIEKHKIHIVAFGQEYLERFPDPKDDPYYRVPREMGIAKPLPRTEGLSTSDLIKRIQSRAADEKKSPT